MISFGCVRFFVCLLSSFLIDDFRNELYSVSLPLNVILIRVDMKSFQLYLSFSSISFAFYSHCCRSFLLYYYHTLLAVGCARVKLCLRRKCVINLSVRSEYLDHNFCNIGPTQYYSESTRWYGCYDLALQVHHLIERGMKWVLFCGFESIDKFTGGKQYFANSQWNFHISYKLCRIPTDEFSSTREKKTALNGNCFRQRKHLKNIINENYLHSVDVFLLMLGTHPVHTLPINTSFSAFFPEFLFVFDLKQYNTFYMRPIDALCNIRAYIWSTQRVQYKHKSNHGSEIWWFCWMIYDLHPCTICTILYT